VVASNPPFNLSNWGNERAIEDPFRRFDRGIPPENRADYAFISHIIGSMRDEVGRSAVVVPLGVLFRSGSEASIRRKLVEENLVHSIVTLPYNLFAATKISVALMIFKRNRTSRDILFIDASQNFSTRGGRNVLRSQDIEQITEAFRHFRHIEGFSRSVSIEEIRAKDFNLRASIYLEKREANTRPLDEVWAETQPIAEELENVREELDILMRRLGLLPD
jgi:type I restriction enzyme M protein